MRSSRSRKDFFVSFTQVLNPFLWLEIGVRLILFALKVCEINFMYSLEKPALVLCKNSRSTHLSEQRPNHKVRPIKII